MSLPVELLDFIVRYSSAQTKARLARTSRTLYGISVRALYASIPHMGTRRTIQCLLVLSQNASLACLVRTFELRMSHQPNFPDLITRALGNMPNLVELSLQLGIFATSSVLERVACHLTKFVCILVSDPAYPISRFLESQPGIKELYLVCRPDSIADLSPDALPALQDVAAPLRLLGPLLSSRLDHITRISALGTIMAAPDIAELGSVIRDAPTRSPPGVLIDVVLGMDLTSPMMAPEFVTAGLACLGLRAPSIGLLRLEVHKGSVQQNMLDEITLALPHLPNLKTLVVMSQPPVSRAYIHQFDRNPASRAHPAIQRPQASSFDVSRDQESPLSSGAATPSPTYRLVPPTASNTEPRSNWPVFAPDALHDRSRHKACLAAWHHAQPSLERVVFPIGVYTFGGKRKSAIRQP